MSVPPTVKLRAENTIAVHDTAVSVYLWQYSPSYDDEVD